MAAREVVAEEERAERMLEVVNDVHLIGRVAGITDDKELPSGDRLRSFRVVVDRLPSAVRSRQRVDALDCVAFTARVRRSLGTWRDGDVVEVSGALRKRFYRGAGGLASRVEVEVTSARRVSRGSA